MVKFSVALVFLLFPLAAFPAIYKCVDSQGKIVFSDSPCPAAVSKPEQADPRTGTDVKNVDDKPQTPAASRDLSRWNPRASPGKSDASPRASDLTLQVERDFIRAVATGADQAVTGSKGGLVQVWNLRQGEMLKQYPVESGGILSLAVAQDRVVVGLDNPSPEHNLQLRDLQQGALQPLAGQTGAIQSLAAADGLIASYALNKTIALWDLKTHRLLKEIKVEEPGDNPTTLHVALGDGLLAASLLRTIQVWDSSTGERLVSLTTPGNVYALALAGGKLFAAAGTRNVLVWNPRTGKALEPLQGHTQWVSSVAAGHGWIVSGAFDNTVNVWDLETGRHLRTLQAKDKVYDVAATADAVLARVKSVVEVWNNPLK